MPALTFTAPDLIIHRIVDTEGPLFRALQMLPDLTPALLDENRPWLQPGAIDAKDRFILCIQSYVIRTPHHTILVDSCVGNDKHRPQVAAWNNRQDTTYQAALAAAGLGFEDIDYVMCTHLHVDHVGWNTRLRNGRWVPSFPNARYIFGAAEYAHWETAHAAAPVEVFADSVLPIVQAGRADLVQNDFTIGDHVRLLPTPGHTPGHVAVVMGKGADHAVFTGDVVHSPLQARYPELSSVFDADRATAAVTRRAVLELYCDTDTFCCFAHFPSPSIGRLRKWGNGFKAESVVV
jgi:glyoxylase-like metal-dependent hydrolase (beta-lactamase superfamily II)